VGVNLFDDDSVTPLSFTVNDAVALTYLFVLELKLMPPDNVSLLLSGEPNTALLKSQLAALGQAGVRRQKATRSMILRELMRSSNLPGSAADLLVVFISTHGFEENGVPFAMPSDGLVGMLAASAIDLKQVEEQMGKSKAGKRLLILDACRVKAVADARGVGAPMSEAFRTALAAAEGQAVLASCDVGQASVEDKNLGHGVFSHFLLNGLRGAAGADTRGFITLGAVSDYVAASVNNWYIRNKPGADLKNAQKPWFKGPNDARLIPLAVARPGGPPVVPPVPVVPIPPGPGPTPVVPPQPVVPIVVQGPRWTNSLGMVFAPVDAAKAWFCVWETRVRDLEAFVAATGHDMGDMMGVLLNDGWKKRIGFNWQKPGFTQGAAHPAVGVSWEDTLAFCKWLTDKEQKEGRLGAGQRYQLPTDEQWSLAAGLRGESGGTPQDRDGKVVNVYRWGAQWPPPMNSGNYAGEETKGQEVPDLWSVITGYRDGFARTAPVGTFAPNEAGLYDLDGNVWEWCDDWYDEGERFKVLRGGAWNCNKAAELLVSARSNERPYSRNDSIGFRVVLTGGPPR
jgi:hypothetical protein